MKANLPSLGLIILLLGFHRISETIYTPALPNLAHHLTGEQGAEFTISVYFIGFALGIFVWGVIADRIGRRLAMLSGLVIYILGSWGCYEAQGLPSLLTSRFIQALGASAGSVVTQTIIRDLYTGKRCNQIFSLVGGYLSIVLALTPFLGGWINEKTDWHGNLAFLVGMGIVILIYALLRLPETQVPQSVQNKRKLETFKEIALKLMKDKQVIGYAILIGACNGIIFIYYTEAPFLFTNLLHYTATEYGLSAALVGIAIVLASILSHRLNASFQGDQILKMGCYTAGAGALGFTLSAFMGHFEEASLLHLVGIFGWVFLLFIGIGLIIPNALGQAIRSYQDTSGTAGALFGLFYYLLIAGFTLIMGVFHDGTALPMPLYFSALALLMIVTLYTCLRPQERLASS